MTSPDDERHALEMAALRECLDGLQAQITEELRRLDREEGRQAAAAGMWLLAALCFAGDLWLARYGLGAQIGFAPVLFVAFFGATAMTLRIGDR